MTDATTETAAEWDGTGTAPAPIGDPGSPLPLDHEPVPAFVLGVHCGTWHAIDATAGRPGCERHHWSACGLPVLTGWRLADVPEPWNPDAYPASLGPCPECRWQVAGATQDFGPALASLKDPLARQVADAIIAANRAEGGDMEDPAMHQLLAAVSRHVGADLFAEDCAEGDCDHAPGGCPLAGRACGECSLRLGAWAGEYEDRLRPECMIPAPCAPLLAIAAHFGVEVPPGPADAELERLRSGAHTLGHMVTHMSRTMRAAQIEMRQNGSAKAIEWILNAIPDVDDNDPADQWNGTESAEEWLDRTAEVAGE
jgi:hypothetical protein